MSIYNPTITGYAPFYIQRGTDATAIDIKTTYGIIIKVHEYPLKLKAKTPYNNDWKDRNGDDEWNSTMHYEAFTLRTQAVVMTNAAASATARAELANAVRAFRTAISQGEFKIWDAWTCFGFQKVRLEEFQQIDEGNFDEKDGHCRLIFSFTLKVNDPTTVMRYLNGVITTA